MTIEKDIINIVPTVMSASLIKHNLSKKKRKSLFELGVDNIVGINMIQATSQAGGW